MANHPNTAQANAQRTYDRRRARSAADTLANIPPNRWDDHTRRVILTLATIAAPSRIDNALDDAFNDGYAAVCPCGPDETCPTCLASLCQPAANCGHGFPPDACGECVAQSEWRDRARAARR